MSNDGDVAWSCVVDNTPEILSSFVPWLATAIELAGIDRSRIHVHHVHALDREIAGLCRALGIKTHEISPFSRDYPHANKIGQCDTAFPDCRRVVLTDVDVAFAAPPPLHELRARVAGKLVDLPNPPLEILQNIFCAAGLFPPKPCSSAFVDSYKMQVEFETLPGNYNGGILAIDRDHLQDIGRAWARWMMAHVDLLERWSYHLDQVAFCLAVNDLGIAAGLLDDAWNFPLHIDALPGGREPFILHHHALLDDRRLLKEATPSTAKAIGRVNGAIESFQHRFLVRA
jgi:hypothetical protein